MRVNKKPAPIYTEHDGRFIEKSFIDYKTLKTHLPLACECIFEKKQIKIIFTFNTLNVKSNEV